MVEVANDFLVDNQVRVRIFGRCCRGAMVISIAQFHSNKPELRFCAGSSPARDMLEISDGEDL